MSAPWFDPMTFGWMPGTTLGVLGGRWGAAVGVLAPQGRAKGLVFAITAALLAASVLMLGLGVLGFFAGQPYGVWYALGLSGLIGLGVIGPNALVVRHRYRQAEERRMHARDVAL